MPQEILLQQPPSCTTLEGAKQLDALMLEFAQKLVKLGGEPLYTSPGNDYHTPESR